MSIALNVVYASCQNGDMEKETTMHVVIPETLKKEFKATCVMEGKNMSEVVVKLIQRWMKEQGKGNGHG